MPHGIRWTIATFAVGLLATVLPQAPGSAAQELPIVDTHAHYSRPAWDVYKPAAIIDKLKAAGVVWALVSSTPDDGTLALHRADPERILPVLRPYRTRADMADWYASDAVLGYMKRRLAGRAYVGIGEFHMSDPAGARTPQMRELIGIAVERGMMLHAHAGAAVVEALLEAEPRLRIHWAHSGFESPEAIGEMMDRHKRLTADVAVREGGIDPGGKLDPAWRALLIRHQDRFMIGSDTWITPRWDDYGGIIDGHRAWLGKLPPDVAEAIAYRNAMRAFGIAPIPALGN